MKALPNKLLVGGNLKRAIVYHGSYSGPKAMVRYVKNGFDAKGAGGLYGYGLYTVFELEGTPTGKGGYGPYVYEFSVDVSRFISFDPKVTRRLFGADLSLEEQVRRVGAHELSPDAYARIREAGVDAAPSSLPFSGSEMALAWWREMEAAPRRAKLPDGILFGGRQDGPVAVLYNMEQARLTRWRTVGTKSVPVFQRGLGRGDGPIGGAISGHWLSPEDAASVGAEFVRVRRLPRMTGVVSARAGVPSGSFEHTPVVRAMTPAQSVYKTRQYHKPVSLQSLIPQASVYGVVRWVLVDGEEEEGPPRILRSEVIIIPTMTPRWGRLTAVQQNEKLAQTLRVVEERRAVLFVSGLDFPQDRQTYVVRGLADVRDLLAGPPLAERDDVVYGSPSLRGIWSVSSAGSFSFLQPSVSMREIASCRPLRLLSFAFARQVSGAALCWGRSLEISSSSKSLAVPARFEVGFIFRSSSRRLPVTLSRGSSRKVIWPSRVSFTSLWSRARCRLNRARCTKGRSRASSRLTRTSLDEVRVFWQSSPTERRRCSR